MSRFLAASALLALTSTAAAESTGQTQSPLDGGRSTPVIGGSAVPPGKWPDAVAVLGTQASCTGTLIAPDVVLTAAHCADGMSRVVADTTNFMSTGGQRAGIVSITTYPNWQESYDIAVLVLDRKLEGIAPRRLGTSCTFDEFETKPMVHLVGFGLTTPEGDGSNTRLNEVMAPVIDPDCSSGNGCMPSIAPGGEFIAGGDNRDSCFGDSGGPVYLDTPRGVVVVGAVSRGTENSPTPCGGGGIYVRTDKLVEWIEETTGREIAKDDCVSRVDEELPEVDGGCATSRGATGLFALVLAALAFVTRRRIAR